MNACSWLELLDNPQIIQDLYDVEPDLSSSELFHVLVDERGNSITLGFQTDQTPARHGLDRDPGDFNSFEFYLTFFDVQGFTVKGWGAPAEKEITYSRSATGNLSVKIVSVGTLLEFQARAASVANVRVGLVSRGE